MDVTDAMRGKIKSEQIRVWVDALKGHDLTEEAEKRLLEFGKEAVPALEVSAKSGTHKQRLRAKDLLDKISGKRAMSTPQENSTDEVRVYAPTEVIEALSVWNKDIWVFTDAKNPLKTLDGLEAEQIAGWGFRGFGAD